MTVSAPGKIAWNGTGLPNLTSTSTTKKGFRMLEQRWELDDQFGLRVFRVVRPDGGSMSVGQVASQERNAGSTITLDAGSGDTVLVDSALAAAVNEFSGKFGPCYVLHTNNNSSAAAAPEGECVLIKSNTATTITLASAFSAAALVSDTIEIHRIGVAEDGAAADLAAETLGVIMATSVTDDDFAFAQCYGFSTGISVPATTVVTQGIGMEHAGSAAVRDAGKTDSGGINIGVFTAGTRPSDTLRNFWPCYIALLG